MLLHGESSSFFIRNTSSSHEPVHKHGHLSQLCVEPVLNVTVLPHENCTFVCLVLNVPGGFSFSGPLGCFD